MTWRCSTWVSGLAQNSTFFGGSVDSHSEKMRERWKNEDVPEATDADACFLKFMNQIIEQQMWSMKRTKLARKNELCDNDQVDEDTASTPPLWWYSLGWIFQLGGYTMSQVSHFPGKPWLQLICRKRKRWCDFRKRYCFSWSAGYATLVDPYSPVKQWILPCWKDHPQVAIICDPCAG